jgi:enoyl-CoA hydratase/carnithine racemase
MALVEYALEDGVARVTLTRPEKRNALSDAMMAEFSVAVERAEAEAKAVVLSGEGDHFSAGLDLSEQTVRSPLDCIEGSRSWHRVFSRIRNGRVPYFAALHGGVIGGGLELASIAHVRVCDASAFFALPEGQRGIFVGGGGSVNVARLMGAARMMDLMLTGRVLSAEEAERIGIVTYLTPKGDALDKAMALARQTITNAPMSNYAIINAIPRIVETGYDEGMFFESMIAAFAQSTPEATDRLRDFLEKRAAPLARPGQ